MFLTMFNYFEKKGLDYEYNSHERITDGSFDTSMTDLIFRAVTMPDFNNYKDEYDYTFDNTEVDNAKFDKFVERDSDDQFSRYDLTDYSDAVDRINRTVSETRDEIQTETKDGGKAEDTPSSTVSREDTKNE